MQNCLLNIIAISCLLFVTVFWLFFSALIWSLTFWRLLAYAYRSFGIILSFASRCSKLMVAFLDSFLIFFLIFMYSFSSALIFQPVARFLYHSGFFLASISSVSQGARVLTPFNFNLGIVFSQIRLHFSVKANIGCFSVFARYLFAPVYPFDFFFKLDVVALTKHDFLISLSILILAGFA